MDEKFIKEKEILKKNHRNIINEVLNKTKTTVERLGNWIDEAGEGILLDRLERTKTLFRVSGISIQMKYMSVRSPESGRKKNDLETF